MQTKTLNINDEEESLTLVEVWKESGRRILTRFASKLSAEELTCGSVVLLQNNTVVELANTNLAPGEKAEVTALLDPENGMRRILVSPGEAREPFVAYVAEHIHTKELEVGTRLLVGSRAHVAFEILNKDNDDKNILTEEMRPDVSFEDIGGLDDIIIDVQEELTTHITHPEVNEKLGLERVRGILLHGPPGTGKTMIAKAIANSMDGYFFSISGPELLNKFVGETEREIRKKFEKAAKLATKNSPSVIFFDELDALVKRRGSGISSDINETIVTTFNAELDGVEGRDNVIIIGATNRIDMIDQAVIRAGRFDLKIKISHPNKEGVRQIFEKKLRDPEFGSIVHPSYRDKYRTAESAVAHMLDEVINMMFDKKQEENQFLIAHYQDGDKKTFTYANFISGAAIENIVKRAKKKARRRHIAHPNNEGLGILKEDLVEAVYDEFEEVQAPSIQEFNQWFAIEGMTEKRIAHVTVVQSGQRDEHEDKRDVENLNVGQGQYL